MNKQDIIKLAKAEFSHNAFNNFAALGFPGEKIWQEIDIGFAAGDDQLFAFFKQDIGDFYWSPSEAFNQLFVDAHIPDKNLSVMSIGFYMTQKLKEEQSRQTIGPTLRWGYARNSWEPLIQDYSRGFVHELEKAGFRVAAIDLAPAFSWKDSQKYGLAANWSQRHTAFAAGLGTFGLCDGLISRHGKAARYTSFILEGKFEPDPRPYKEYHDWCLFYKNGSCKECMKICPANAISEKGHNKAVCAAYCSKIMNEYGNDPALQPRHASWCGLCQGAVPCQNGIPEGIF
jgi:epoxyqueuosine reductase